MRSAARLPLQDRQLHALRFDYAVQDEQPDFGDGLRPGLEALDRAGVPPCGDLRFTRAQCLAFRVGFADRMIPLPASKSSALWDRRGGFGFPGSPYSAMWPAFLNPASAASSA